MRQIRSLAIALAGGLILAACGDVRTNPLLTGLEGGPGGTSTFNITPQTITLQTGQTTALTVNSSRVLAPYVWATNLPGVATVDGSGNVTAIGPGVATISVTSQVDRTVSARATVTVQPRTGDGTSGGGTG